MGNIGESEIQAVLREIIKQLEPLFEEAEKKGLWFYSSAFPHQGLWFAPTELREYQETEGRYVWGPHNWQLRDPQEKVSSMKQDVENLQKQIKIFEAQIRGYEAYRKRKEATT